MASANSVKNKVSTLRHQVSQIQSQSVGHDRKVGDALASILDVLDEITQVLRDRESARHRDRE